MKSRVLYGGAEVSIPVLSGRGGGGGRGGVRVRVGYGQGSSSVIRSHNKPICNNAGLNVYMNLTA